VEVVFGFEKVEYELLKLALGGFSFRGCVGRDLTLWITLRKTRSLMQMNCFRAPRGRTILVNFLKKRRMEKRARVTEAIRRMVSWDELALEEHRDSWDTDPDVCEMRAVGCSAVGACGETDTSGYP
jgi:hypothetical protein